MIQRRLYIYIVAAASLAMVLIGLVNLGTTALNQLFDAVPPYSNVRDSYAGFGATTLVGLPVWGIHWWLAQRFARRNADERASALRRLYLYLVLAATGVAAAILARSLLEHAAGFLLGTSTDGPSIGRALWGTLVLFAAWLYHFRTAAVDRAIAGESGDSATLRRWYGYGLLLLGLAFLLFGARNLLQQGWVLLVDSGETIVPGNLVPSAMATMLTGLVVFGFHLRWTSRAPLAADDRSSTLRAVQGFLALAASVALALFGASQLSYYVLARLLGVDHPGGVANNILVAVAGPVATVVVFSLAWVWIRRQLTTDAGEVEATRQAGVRHLYTHLVAFLALATLAIGAAGLLWTISDQVLNTWLNRPVGEWRDRVSLFITLMLVGAPMWRSHWRASPVADERYTLSRRLYLYASLLGSVLAALIAGALFVYRLLALVLGTGDTAGSPLVDMAKTGSVILVATVIGLYHWRALRSDAAARPAPAPRRAVIDRDVHLIITGASEEEVRRLLGGLPEGASYSIDAPK